MIKRIGMYSLPPGTDEDEWWRYHSRVHARDFVRAGGDDLVRYTINRVTQVIRGQKVCFAIVETWYEDEEAMKRVYERSYGTRLENGNSIEEDFVSRVVDLNSYAVEEFIAKK